MRSTKTPGMFFLKMRKKPALQAILDNLENHTDEQIDQSSQPLWIREQLKKLKRFGSYEEVKAAVMAAAIAKEPERDLSQTYPVGRWISGSHYVGKIGIEMCVGDLVMFQPQVGLAKIAGHTVQVSANDMATLQANCVLLGSFTMNQYNEMHVAHLNSKY